MVLPLNAGEPGERLSGDNRLSGPGDRPWRAAKCVGDEGLLEGLLPFKVKAFIAFIGPCLWEGETFLRTFGAGGGPCPDISMHYLPMNK